MGLVLRASIIVKSWCVCGGRGKRLWQTIRHALNDLFMQSCPDDTMLFAPKKKVQFVRQRFANSMPLIRLKLVLFTIAGLAVTGCSRSDPDPPGGGDPPIWIEADIVHAGRQISLGYRGEAPNSAGEVEPVTMITLDGMPVADALVFHTLVAEEDSEAVEEAATVYELSSDRERGHYAKAILKTTEDGRPIVVRYRIVFAGESVPWSKDVTLPGK